MSQLSDKSSTIQTNELSSEFAHLLSIISDSIVVISKEFTIIEASQGFVELVGKGKHAILGQNCCQVFDCSVCKSETCPLERLTKGGQSESVFVIGSLTLQGRLTTLDQNGTLSGYLLKLLPQASEEFIFNQFPTLVWHSNFKNELNYINGIWTRCTGQSPEQALVDGWQERIHPDDKEAFVAGYNDTFKKREPFRRECRLLGPNGKYNWYLVLGNPFYDLNGEFKGYIGTNIDIQAQKNSEIKSLRMYEQLKAVLDSTPSAVITLDLCGRIQTWNTAAEKMFAWKKEEVIGKPIPFLCQKEHQRHFERLKRLLKGEPVVNEELVTHSREGNTVEVRLYAGPIYNNLGQITAFIGILDNITGLKQIKKEAVIAKKKAEEALRLASLSAMAAGIAHEINQPLNNLKIIADSMLFWQMRGEYLPEEIAENLRKICGQVNRISMVVSNMHSLARRGCCTSTESVVLDEKVVTTLNLMKGDLKELGVQLVTKFSSPGVRIQCNEYGLQSIISNIIRNSLQAFNSSKTEEKQIMCESVIRNGFSIIKIHDNALGIDKRILHQITEPFFSTKVGKCMGLGLFIVETRVKSFGGSIEIKNNRFGGVTVTLSFPLEDAKFMAGD